jgi:hypothetical protein
MARQGERSEPLSVIFEADPWPRSSATEEKLVRLVDEGLLRPRTDPSRPEWIAPRPEEEVPHPPEGYVVSLMEYHKKGFGVPASRFMRGLLYHYEIELHHLPPNSVSQAAIFATLCEGFMGVEPHWDLWLWFFKAELNTVVSGGKGSPRKAVRVGSCIPQLRGPAEKGGRSRADEYIVSKLTASNKGWQEGWFYLRNDGGGLPPYTGRVIKNRPDRWFYGPSGHRPASAGRP